MRAGKCVPTGKVTIIATLDIFGIGKKASTGEMWADDDNAVTRAEAQAKKRAASMFGLGEYFYRFKELGSVLWVPLDERGNATKVPDLPGWAMPAGTRPKTTLGANSKPFDGASQQQALVRKALSLSRPPLWRIAASRATGSGATRPRRPRQFRRSKTRSTPSVSQSRSFVQPARCKRPFSALTWRTTSSKPWRQKLDVGEIKGEKFGLATAKLDAAVALLTKIREVAEHTHPSALRTLLLRHELQNLNTIPTFQRLYRIALDMQVVPAIERTRSLNLRRGRITIRPLKPELLICFYSQAVEDSLARASSVGDDGQSFARLLSELGAWPEATFG